MKLKEMAKNAFIEYFHPIMWVAKFIAKTLEKAGLRCIKCGAWGRRKTCFGSVIEELAPSPKRWYRMRVCYCPKCKNPSKAIKVYVPEHVEGMP